MTFFYQVLNSCEKRRDPVVCVIYGLLWCIATCVHIISIFIAHRDVFSCHNKSAVPDVPLFCFISTFSHIVMYSIKITVILVRFKRNRLPKNNHISNFMKILPVGAELFRANRRTDMMKVIISFIRFVKSSSETRMT
jgi:hypothetical protein